MPSNSSKAKFNVITETRPDFTGNVYNSSVLVGNWFEERCSDKSDLKAITPGIYGKSGCVKDITTYGRDYANVISADSHLSTRSFIDWKQQGFSNRLNGENTSIKLWDSDEFVNNITTLNDITYRILPSQKYASDAKRKGKQDFLRSFGNTTKTGLLQWRACERFIETNTPIDVSHYRQNFKPVRLEQNVCPPRNAKVKMQ